MAAQISTTETELLTHAQTYHRFTLGLKWVAIHLATIIAFLIVWFATPGGFFGGLFVGAVVLAVGVWAMNHGLNHSTERDNPGSP
jgi:hypothetical protein